MALELQRIIGDRPREWKSYLKRMAHPSGYRTDGYLHRHAALIR